ncbi:hypothetical protein KIN20_030030 [Parelaphostrongylus tenuis]|uniref:Uncharacterized protein n=1 Tax=Parelaphostrongylus tenuis TaxID=148309 RepID=A0AAD5R377_PARTN|nr:hypothetical protein KIN20_030030 [Parelaphostrongylus tenuis]
MEQYSMLDQSLKFQDIWGDVLCTKLLRQPDRVSEATATTDGILEAARTSSQLPIMSMGVRKAQCLEVPTFQYKYGLGLAAHSHFSQFLNEMLFDSSHRHEVGMIRKGQHSVRMQAVKDEEDTHQKQRTTWLWFANGRLQILHAITLELLQVHGA